jgi:hypothetical protein
VETKSFVFSVVEGKLELRLEERRGFSGVVFLGSNAPPSWSRQWKSCCRILVLRSSSNPLGGFEGAHRLVRW